MTARTALPGRMVDLIHDGIPRADLRAAGDQAVWKALVRTAASATQRGHTYPEWAALLDHTNSNLGRQAKLRATGKERTRSNYEKTLQHAWDTAGRWLQQAPPAYN